MSYKHEKQVPIIASQNTLWEENEINRRQVDNVNVLEEIEDEKVISTQKIGPLPPLYSHSITTQISSLTFKSCIVISYLYICHFSYVGKKNKCMQERINNCGLLNGSAVYSSYAMVIMQIVYKVLNKILYNKRLIDQMAEQMNNQLL